MKVNSCMSAEVRTCAPDDTIQSACRTMQEIDSGILPVAENDRLVGMITDRDIALRAVADGQGPETTARAVMSPKILYCFDDQELDEVSMEMADLQVRRMPVLNRDKRLVGIISLGDMALVDEGGGMLGGEALVGISQPDGDARLHP